MNCLNASFVNIAYGNVDTPGCDGPSDNIYETSDQKKILH